MPNPAENMPLCLVSPMPGSVNDAQGWQWMKRGVWTLNNKSWEPELKNFLSQEFPFTRTYRKASLAPNNNTTIYPSLLLAIR